MVCFVVLKRGYFLVHHGCSSELFGPIPHDSRHSSPFYLKGPRTATTGKSPETRGHPGCNDKSKDHPRAHKRRIKPSQDLSFRYPWDSVSRSHKTGKLCMLHIRPCGTPYTHNAPTIYFDIPEKYLLVTIHKILPQVLLNSKYIVLMGGSIQGNTFPNYSMLRMKSEDAKTFDSTSSRKYFPK